MTARPGRNSTSNGRLKFITSLPAYSSLTPIIAAIDTIRSAYENNSLITISLLNEYAIDDVINHVNNPYDHIALTVHNQTIVISFLYDASCLECTITLNDISETVVYEFTNIIDTLDKIIETIKPQSFFEKVKHFIVG